MLAVAFLQHSLLDTAGPANRVVDVKAHVECHEQFRDGFRAVGALDVADIEIALVVREHHVLGVAEVVIAPRDRIEGEERAIGEPVAKEALSGVKA